MVSKAVYAGIAIAVVIPLAIFAVYSTTIEPEPAGVEDAAVAEEPRILVLSSFYPIWQFVNAVGGDRIESELVLPPGAEPHDWEPTVRDAQRMQNADAIAINGIGFETWLDSLEDINFEGVLIDTSKGVEVMEAAEGTHGHDHGHGHEEESDDHGDDDHGMEAKDDHGDDDHGMEAKDDHGDDDHGMEAKDDHGDDDHGMEAKDDHGDDDHGMEAKDDHGDDDHGMEAKDDHGDDDHGMEAKDDHGDDHDDDDHVDKFVGDPHIWLNPVLAQIQVQNIADGLSEADPKNADYYQENADRYIAELQQLDSDIRTGLESCSREFVAYHFAFAYFSEEYDLVQHVILRSLTPYGEIAPRTLHDVIETARAQGLDIIFTDEAADPKTAQVVADEIGGRVLTLSPLEIVPTDETYMSKMYQNLENLQAALC